jgi:hypothetical protein
VEPLKIKGLFSAIFWWLEGTENRHMPPTRTNIRRHMVYFGWLLATKNGSGSCSVGPSSMTSLTKKVTHLY